MPLPGGPTDKLGNRYELQWTVCCIADVLAERAISIRLEPPGAEGTGVEFWLQRDRCREYHQTKRGHGAQGRWTVAVLNREGVLRNALTHLRDGQSEFFFVSSDSVVHLRDLAEHARSAVSANEFLAEFLKNEDRKCAFQRLCAYWDNCSEAEAYQYLRRLHIRTADEGVVRRMVEAQLGALIDGDVRNAADVLAELALSSPHSELTALDLWRHLEDRGFRRRVWYNDSSVVTAVDAANKTYLGSVRRLAILGRPLPRTEAEAAAANLLASDGDRGVVLHGDAGIGKSGAVAQAVEELRRQQVPVLAFRADRLKTTFQPKDIGVQLGLPDSPVRVLAAVARDRRSVLVIDQLDAISMVSGRLVELLDPIAEIVEEALTHPNMRVLLGCRSFDLQHDDRFRALIGGHTPFRRLKVSALDADMVRAIVGEIGIDPATLTADQIVILSTPLHLKLFEGIAEGGALQPFSFRDATELYDRYWERKQQLAGERAGRPVAWLHVIDALVEHMSESHSLDAPRDVVDEHAADAAIIASEGVLVEEDERRYAFFHESFFDYVFARLFARKGADLVQFLEGDEQRLFRRAQVRQVLRYERATRPEQYARTLAGLLHREGIRFHIKAVVAAVLGAVPDPRDEELALVCPLLEQPTDPLGREMWQAIYQSGAWFRALDERGSIAQFLASGGDRLVDMTCWWLRGIAPLAPERVAELLQGYVGMNEAWHRRLLSVLDGARLAGSRALFDLFLHLVDTGALDRPTDSAFVGSDGWMAIEGLATRQPEWACELIGRWLRRATEVSDARGVANPFDGAVRPIRSDPEIAPFFTTAAGQAPISFIAHVFPPMLDIMAKALIREGDQPWRDAVWGTRFAGDERDESMALLTAAETALATLARNDPAAFTQLAAALHSLPFETIQFLLIRAYAAAGAALADEAAEYLCESTARLECGYANAGHWATQQLLTAITPNCSEDRLRQIEQAIMRHYTRWERTADGRKDRGYGQLLLLRHIDAERISPEARRRLSELMRKFGNDLPDNEPQRIEAYAVPSPIPDRAIGYMSDDAWRRAMAKYNNDERRGRRMGSLHQLASQLEVQAMLEPERFVRLALTLPDNTNPAYFEAILRGTAKAGKSPDALLPLWRRCHELPGRPCGRDLCHAIAEFSEANLRAEAINMVIWYAVEGADPHGEPSVLIDGEESVLTAGLNTTRGGAAFSLAKLLFADGSRLPQLIPALERLVRDASIAVRSWVAEILSAVLNEDRDLAVELFECLCEADDQLLTASTIERFISFASESHYERMASIIERMIASGIPAAMSAGARQACRAGLDLTEAQALAADCVKGEVELRIGAAQVFAAHVATARIRSFCEERLGELFDDEAPEVRNEAAECFRFIEPESLIDYGDLIGVFAASSAFGDYRFHLVHALRRCSGKLPDTTTAVCERFVDVAGDEAGDIRTRSAAEADTISRLIARLYSQATDRVARSRCLDAIDRLLQARAFGLDEALRDIER